MASYDNAYSRFVALARIVLPLAALGLLSTLFLVSRGEEEGPSLPFARVDVEEMAREQRVGAPEYAGLTDDGSAIALTADAARPDPVQAGRASAETLHLRLDMPDGGHAELTAASGLLDMQAGHTVLEGGVHIESSAGYTLDTERATAALDRTEIVTDGPVEGLSPVGRISAGHMRITEQAEAPGQYLLVFKDGVRLVYDPEG
ncbi:LPS export ABC transporter periplasmic protein LptC [Rhodovulum adriaticum]|uniref:Lipopolysaccharide export system protein LptC n=1 Tax=Rhodovulum adriaticum TaxID=35804 RepID=A0A4R2P0E7_RHOAD|nr:LPS export ABC transporter periplasmic protein LptC [Rhodovulum adriaticum]MBK1634894.1 hypothetical protein [Rhodovulum adriaticum]TCP27364.1 lipopolysaccharide export system protein LptC [Rhodovulum adriaticum]